MQASCPGDLPADIEVTDYRGRLILPGFIDTHVHYPQTDMIASYGEQLLEWLETYAYATERRFADPAHAREVADFFLAELLRNGTTTAMVFATVHKASVDAFFAASEAIGTRMLAGKVMMDRNCPDFLRDTAEASYEESAALIAAWHEHGRQLYAVTPRFAAASTERQLELAGALLDEHQGVYLQSHVAENREEVAWVAETLSRRAEATSTCTIASACFARARCTRTASTSMRKIASRMAESGAAMSFCPTSNLFLGSGLFDIEAARRHSIRVGIGTDIGAGTSFSMFRTLDEAYKVAQLRGQNISPERAFYLATLGGARALYLDDRIGNFEAGEGSRFRRARPRRDAAHGAANGEHVEPCRAALCSDNVRG